MWFLGAGASASAGIPTAEDMIWEFKQLLFVSQRKVSPKAVNDLSNPAVRQQLQAHIDSLGTLPSRHDPLEYAALFEAVYPAESDRQSYLRSKVTGAKPSYGHLALATLMRAALARVIWTTNFDPLIADACAIAYESTGPLTTVALDAPEVAKDCLDRGRWPLEIKLHGDFRHRRLKNTSDELRHQDERLRRVFVESCGRFGLVVVGYSGRDASIMEALRDALKDESPFPSGIFWLHRGDEPSPRVSEFLHQVEKAGVEGGLVRIESIDETMRDLIRLVPSVGSEVLEAFEKRRPRYSAAPVPSGTRGWPVIRLNALHIAKLPSLCRRVVCRVGGARETREAVHQAGVDVLATRTRSGVLAFGADADVRKAFVRHTIEAFDLHEIEPQRLRYESGERGLLRDALTRAVRTRLGLDHVRRRSVDLLAPADPSDERWNPMRASVGSLGGEVRGAAGLRWREGVGTRMDWADSRLWLLFEPRIVFDGLTPENKSLASEFARERTVKRYNRELNALLNIWLEVLANDGAELRALNVADGVDATFALSSTTAFSRRAGA